MTDFETYQSPFSWRYGSTPMRAIWSEVNKRLLWRRIWVAMAEAQIPFGIVSPDQVEDLAAHSRDVDVDKALEIEKQIHHDLMAEIHVFAGQSPKGGGIIHVGATSMDVKDNAKVLQIRESMDLILKNLAEFLKAFEHKIREYADLPVMAFTHLQPAEPTTLGYRLASYAQDFLDDHEDLSRIRDGLKGKGFKGAVGTAAANVALFGEEGQSAFEESMSRALDLRFYPVSTQTYTRRQDYSVVSALARLAASAHKFALDLRLLQSEVIGELSEPFGRQQVGSSAMPFKRNPVEAEKICSLARLVSSAPLTAWGNHANSLLERTLDDSANRRVLFPQTFLAVDEILLSLIKIMEGLIVHPASIKHNLDSFGPFSTLERVLVEAVKHGADRQIVHETLRKISIQAWDAIQRGEPNPLAKQLKEDQEIVSWFPEGMPDDLLIVESYVGNAVSQAKMLADQINSRLES
ncbi:MAG: adenylosuccinate lyase [Chloroflexi bacterium]|nr:adenylosuccinate lyase [Chloroflexota bacterium]